MIIQLSTGLVFELRGKKYRIEKMLEPNVAKATNLVDPVDVLTLTSTDFSILIGRQELKFLSECPARTLISDFSMLPEDRRGEAVRAWQYLSDVFDSTVNTCGTLDLVKDSINKTASRLNDPSPPSVATVYRWKRKFVSSGSDIRVLVKDYASRGGKNPRLDLEVHQIIEQQIQEQYSRSRFCTVNDLKSRVDVEIGRQNKIRESCGLPLLKAPHFSTIRKRIRKLNPYNLIESKFGKKAAEKIYRYIGKKEEPTRPLELCQIDHTELDLFVLSRKNNLPLGGRPTITLMMDVFSRSVLGFYLGFDPAGYLPVMYCMHHSISPKSYMLQNYPDIRNPWLCHGIPEVLVTDNANEFIHRSLEDACFQLNIKLVQAPRGEPQFKGVIERFIQTQNSSLLHSIPGATFSDKRSKTDELLKYGYDPQKDAIIYLDDLIEILHTFYSDYYHQKPHRSLQNRTPDSVWKEGVQTHALILPSSNTDLLVTLGRIETRKLTRLGIEWIGLYYNSHELTPLRIREKGKMVNFKYDPSDISKIFVYDKMLDTYITTPALDQKNTIGVSLWEHNVVLRYAKENFNKVDSSTLSQARIRIQDIIDKNISKAQVRPRKKVSRYMGVRFDHTKISNVTNYADVPIDVESTAIVGTQRSEQPLACNVTPDDVPVLQKIEEFSEGNIEDEFDNLEVFECSYDES